MMSGAGWKVNCVAIRRHLDVKGGKTVRGVRVPSMPQLLVSAAAATAACVLALQLLLPEQSLHSGSSVEALQLVEELAAGGRASIPDFAEALADREPKTRRNGLIGLARLGPEAADALPQLSPLLEDPSPMVREYAVVAVRATCPNQADAAAKIAPMLADADAGVANAAVTALRGIGGDATPAVLAMLTNAAPSARIRAVRVLRGLCGKGCGDDVADAVGRLLGDPDGEVRLQALAARAAWGVGDNSEIRVLLRSRSPISEPTDGRDAIDLALDAIAARGELAADLVPDLAVMFDEVVSPVTTAGGQRPSAVEDGPRLARIFRAVSAMKSMAQPLVPDLIALADKANSNSVRLGAARALHAVGARSADVTPILLELLAEGNPQGATWDAGELLVRINPDEARQQVGRLIGRVVRPDLSINERALYSLYCIASEGRAARTLLANLLEHSNHRVYELAAGSLAKLGPDAAAAVPNLVNQLGSRDRNDHDRALAARVFASIGPAARSALPALLATLSDAEQRSRQRFPGVQVLREEVVDALAAIGESTEPVVAAVGSQLICESPRVRVAVIRALARLAPDSPRGANAILVSLEDSDPAVRAVAALAAANLRGERNGAIATLTDRLDDENPYVQTAAAITLGKIGPNAKSALPALRKAAEAEEASQSNALFWQSFAHGQRPESAYLLGDLDQLSVAGEAYRAIAGIEAGEVD